MAQEAASIVDGGTAAWLVDGALPANVHSRLHWAYNYWRGKCGARAWPLREAIDPLDFPRDALPATFILERLEAEDDYQVRLAGELYSQLYGREVTGLRATDLIPRDGEGGAVYQDFADSLAHGRPVLRTGWMNWRPEGVRIPYQRILLPVGLGCERADILIGIGVVFGLDGRLRY
ncbi:PAS domain-containing protein [Oceanibaculum pacificum]|uniref:PAS domain-containing protein n=1 Tax=Oceanibaculum pacificum TaxID=580166 RepID=A0A154VQ84_9PROT|nr:PAS domain-containing protein [Oceanibaculum pacificum]KZD03399.1 hypothetical protein AUP43_13085 [Oceanibaculum pacificum]